MDEMRERLVRQVSMDEMEAPMLRRSISEYEQLVQRLGEMGFDSRAIETVISFTGAHTVEEVVDYLLRGEHGWEHEFLPQESNFRICEICGESPRHHSSHVQSVRTLRPPRFNGLTYKMPDNPCSICFNEMEQPWSHPQCGTHRFCTDCVQEYLAIKINEAQVAAIACPGENCEALFDDALLEEMLPPALFTKYARFRRRNEILKDPNVRWCRTPDCEGYMHGSLEQPKLTCPVCSGEMCFRCGEAWHLKSCDDAIDKAYETWAKGKEVQLCPRCRRRIEKIDGCNHMTCTVCEYEWCWLCRGRYTEHHFNPLNPFGCANLQGGEQTRENWPLYRIYLRRTGRLCLWFLGIIFFPLILWAIPGVEVARYCYSELEWRDYGRCSRTTLAALAFIGVFILTPVAFVLAIPVLLIYLIVSLIKCIAR